MARKGGGVLPEDALTSLLLPRCPQCPDRPSTCLPLHGLLSLVASPLGSKIRCGVKKSEELEEMGGVLGEGYMS